MHQDLMNIQVLSLYCIFPKYLDQSCPLRVRWGGGGALTTLMWVVTCKSKKSFIFRVFVERCVWKRGWGHLNNVLYMMTVWKGVDKPVE